MSFKAQAEVFKSYRKPDKPLKLRSVSKSQTLIPSKREKFKKLIKERLMKKFSLKTFNDLIEEEITSFISCEKLTDNDLKLLEERVKSILSKQNINDKSIEKYDNLKASSHKRNENQEISNRLLKSTTDNNYNTNDDNKKINYLEDPIVPEEELILPKKRTHKYEYEQEDDMWNAFNNISKRLYEKELEEEKQKDYEIKRRLKMNFDQQVIQKLEKKEEEKAKADEYHSALLKHVEYLNFIEDQKQAKIKAKLISEKYNREKQIWDQRYRKKVEKIKDRKFDINFLEQNQKEIDEEIEFNNKKKEEAKKQLKLTIEENKRNKILKEQKIREEDEEEKKCVEEYTKILIKQEQDRLNYFKNIEKNSSDFLANAAETVLKDIKIKNEVAEKKLLEFLKQREIENNENEKLLKIKSIQNKKEIKNFLDYQVQEKKRLSLFDKEIDIEQGNIIKKDYEMYNEYLKDQSKKVCF